jgi:hypothetical protein
LLRDLFHILAAMQDPGYYRENPLLMPADQLLEGRFCSILGQSNEFAFVLLTIGQNANSAYRLCGCCHIFWDVRHQVSVTSGMGMKNTENMSLCTCSQLMAMLTLHA